MPFRLERSPNLPALHGQVIQAPALHVHQLDDHIIASHTLEEHQDQLTQFFTILQENILQVNPAKCVFAASAVEFLGRCIDQHSVRPLQQHIKAIGDSPPPPSGCETIAEVFRYGEYLQMFYARYRLQAACTQRGPQYAGVAAHRCPPGSQGCTGGCGPVGAPCPERCALPSH
jgi:hypothetical protein